MESSQHTQCIYRDKLGKLTNYKTLPVNPNNTIQSNLEGSKPLTILSSQIKRNTQVKWHLFDQAKHLRGSLSISLNHMPIYISELQTQAEAHHYYGTNQHKAPKQSEYAVI